MSIQTGGPTKASILLSAVDRCLVIVIANRNKKPFFPLYFFSCKRLFFGKNLSSAGREKKEGEGKVKVGQTSYAEVFLILLMVVLLLL